MDKPYFIVNPVSGSGLAAQKFKEVSKLLEAKGVDFSFDYTAAPRHATALAKAAIERGKRLIAAVGGDGTVNEVAAATIGTDAVLAVLPFGTGNDFTKVMGFAKDVEGAADTILNGTVKNADAAEVNGRPFINVAGLGFDVAVLKATEKFKNKYNGMLPYMLGIIDTLSHLKAMPLTIEHDGVTEKCDSIIMSVGNGQYIGGGMRAVPMADPFDGMLDICYVERVSIFKFICLLPKFIKGKHIKHKDIVHHIRTAEIKVSCPEACALQLDGEVDMTTPAVFRALPGALKVLLPADAK